MAIFGRLVLLLALVARVGADRGLREDDARSPAALARDFLEPNLSRPRLGLTDTNHGREAKNRGPRAVVGSEIYYVVRGLDHDHGLDLGRQVGRIKAAPIIRPRSFQPAG